MQELTQTWERVVRRWVSLRPARALGLDGLQAVASEVVGLLERAGLQVEVIERSGHAPLLVGRAAGTRPEGFILGIYGHYDVEPAGPGWSSPPFEVTDREGRLWGRGLGDDLGPLALRLLALPMARRRPNLLWVIEGEEEVGSPLGLEAVSALGLDRVDGWLDETGYFLADGRQRVLTLGDGPWLDLACDRIEALSVAAGRSVVLERRRLRRAAPEGSRSFTGSLFGDRPYLAIGPNDELSHVHAPDESLDPALLELSAAQFAAVLEAAADVDGRTAP